MRELIRLTLCGFTVGVIWNLLSVVSLAMFAPDFSAAVQRGAPYPGQGGEYFFAIDVLMGVWAVWFYSAIAPRYGTKPTTVAITAVAWWTLKTLQSAKWAGLGLVGFDRSLVPLGVATLGATVLASVVGIWLYNKASHESPHDFSAT